MNPVYWSRRDELPIILNDLGLTGIGVEVGVQAGIFSEYIRQHWNGKLLIGVDPWVAYPRSSDSQERYEFYLQEAGRRLRATGREFTFLRKTSLAAAREFAEVRAVFDFVYIDADHTYESVSGDIAAWWPLVKPGGIFAGHDYIANGWHRPDEPRAVYGSQELAGPGSSEYGIIKAVLEFAERIRDTPSITAPEDCEGWRSWLFRKPA